MSSMEIGSRRLFLSPSQSATSSRSKSSPSPNGETKDSEAQDVSCCPLCRQPWTPPAELRFAHGKAYWKGVAINCQSGKDSNPSEGGFPIRLLKYLWERPGKAIRVGQLIEAIWEDQVRGKTPTVETFRVHLARLRRGIRSSGLPVEIRSQAAAYGGDLYSGSLMLIFKADQ